MADRKTRTPGWSLDQVFYMAPEIYQEDMAQVFAQSWLFAGHLCQIPNPGDFFTYDLGRDSLIILHGMDGEIRALHNVCRHRGSRLCKSGTGHMDKIICPYHQWRYDTAGALQATTWMGDDFDPADFNLHQASVRNTAGLIHICLSDTPPDFEDAAADLARLLQPHGLSNAKVAYTETYRVPANWKLVIENQRECYHCPAKHKTYAKIQHDTDVHDDDKQGMLEARVKAAREKWSALGLDTSQVRPSSKFNGGWWRANRAPFREGCVSETMDGQQVAPLMGSFTDADVGNARANTYPNFWLHASCDHAHTVRVTPINAETTELQANWLVRGDAVDGKHYDTEAVIAFSKLVNDEDEGIIINQALGVASSRYQPGPLSPVKEELVDHFLDWYMTKRNS
jgi:glycine betaine catabolism A